MGSKKKRAAADPHRLANEERWKAFHGLRSSNAAQPHVPRPRKGARAAVDRRAIREQRDDRLDSQ